MNQSKITHVIEWIHWFNVNFNLFSYLFICENICENLEQYTNANFVMPSNIDFTQFDFIFILNFFSLYSVRFSYLSSNCEKHICRTKSHYYFWTIFFFFLVPFALFLPSASSDISFFNSSNHHALKFLIIFVYFCFSNHV